MDKLANAIVGFNLINKYQPNSNQWKRIIELFGEEFDEDIGISDEEYSLVSYIKNFIDTNEIPTREEWLSIISLCEDIISVNYEYDEDFNEEDDEVNFIKDYIDEYVPSTIDGKVLLSVTDSEVIYSSQEEMDNIVYSFHNMDKEEVNELLAHDILNNFVVSSYLDPQFKLKF